MHADLMYVHLEMSPTEFNNAYSLVIVYRIEALYIIWTNVTSMSEIELAVIFIIKPWCGDGGSNTSRAVI